MSTRKKIVIVVAGLSIVGLAAYLLLKKKPASPGETAATPAIGNGSNSASSVAENNIDPAPGWSYERDTTGTSANPYWAWGYVKDNQGNPIEFPRIKVYTPDGNKQYGGIYIGDKTGAWGFAIPDETYQIEISDSFDADKKYYSYKNPARVVSNGYKLFIRKLTE